MRRVRFQYPQAYLELVELLTVDSNRRLVASTLSLPLSTVYRWANSCCLPDWAKPGWTRSKNSASADYINARLEICKKNGFDITEKVVPLVSNVYGLTSRELSDFVQPRSYNFVAELSGEIVVGNFRFPRGASGPLETTASIVREAEKFPCPSRHRLLLAKMEIDNHYYTRISCSVLARMLGMGRFNFIREFKSLFGISPYQYLNQVRVSHAKQMLALTDQPLKIIATGVGFSSESSMSKAFRRFEGASPAKLYKRLGPAPSAERAIA